MTKKKFKKVKVLLIAGLLTFGVAGVSMQTKYEYNSSATNNAVQVKQVGTTKTSLKMRSTNSTKGKVVATLKKGTKVDALKKMSNGWYQVKYGSKTGYINGSSLTVTDKKVTSKPVESKPVTTKPTGISFSDFRGRLASMGWQHEVGTTYTYQDATTNQGLGQVRATDDAVYFALFANNAQFDGVIRQCFNLLLPTQGGRLYNIVSNTFSNQTLTMDGRTVTIKDTGVYVAVTITN